MNVSLLDGAVEDINRTLEFLANAMSQLSPTDLIEFRTTQLDAIKKAVSLVDGEITRCFVEAGVDVVHDGCVHFPSRSKSAERWDSEAIVSQMAARATDWVFSVDRETGEMAPVPPVVLATKIVTAVAKACGALAPSHGFRTTALQSEFGLSKDEVARYRTSEPGGPVIGKRPVKASDIEGEAA